MCVDMVSRHEIGTPMHYANQPVRPLSLVTFKLAAQFHIYSPWVG